MDFAQQKTEGARENNGRLKVSPATPKPTAGSSTAFSLRLGHARGKTIPNRFLRPSRRFATSRREPFVWCHLLAAVRSLRFLTAARSQNVSDVHFLCQTSLHRDSFKYSFWGTIYNTPNTNNTTNTLNKMNTPLPSFLSVAF